MMRRSFRYGLRLGVLGGIAAAVATAVRARRPAPAIVDTPAAPAVGDGNQAWPPIQPAMRAEVETPAPVKKAVKKASAAKKAPAAKKVAAPAPVWVEPVGSVCPPSHPVKAKLTSRLYHLPGMFAYARAVPDRCYGTPEQAEADGLNRAKR